MTHFPENLRQIRKFRNISQAVLADKIGVSPTAVSNYEAKDGYGTPDLEKLVKISKILDVSIDDLLQLNPQQMKQKITANNFVNTGTIHASNIHVNEPRANYPRDQKKTEKEELEEYKVINNRLEGQVALLLQLLIDLVERYAVSRGLKGS